MPYIPSKKTDGKSKDREILDEAVEALALQAALQIKDNLSVIEIYKQTFRRTVRVLTGLFDHEVINSFLESELGQTIYDISEKYGYQGAFLGELNYAFTRFIQRVPQVMVEKGIWKDEFRYWLYAATVEALTYAHDITKGLGKGISGVFEDIKDEYKWRVNRSYEATQIIKSGDCYDTPYYGRLVEVIDEKGSHIGHMEVWLKRSEETLHQDLLDGKIVLKKKKSVSKK